MNDNAFSDWFDGQPLGVVVRRSINEFDIDYVDMLTAASSSSNENSGLFQPKMSDCGKMIDSTDCRERIHSWPGRSDRAAAFNGYGGSGEGSDAEAGPMGTTRSSVLSSSADSEQKNAEIELECSRDADDHLTVVTGMDACTWSTADESGNISGGARSDSDLVGSSEPTSSSVVPRRNAWGNQSYAELITQAIESSIGKRMTLSQIYEWLVRNVPYFSNKGDSYNSAGWKNSIRHNLSLHSRFMRISNDTAGKSSWWMINHDAKLSKTCRRRAPSMDTITIMEKKKGRAKNKVEFARRYVVRAPEIDSTATSTTRRDRKYEYSSSRGCSRLGITHLGSSPLNFCTSGYVNKGNSDLFRSRLESNGSATSIEQLSPIHIVPDSYPPLLRHVTTVSGSGQTTSSTVIVEPIQLSRGDRTFFDGGEYLPTMSPDDIYFRDLEMTHQLLTNENNNIKDADDRTRRRSIGNGYLDRTLSESIADVLVEGNHGNMVTCIKRETDIRATSMMTSPHNGMLVNSIIDDARSLYPMASQTILTSVINVDGGCSERRPLEGGHTYPRHGRGCFRVLAAAMARHQRMKTAHSGLHACYIDASQTESYCAKQPSCGNLVQTIGLSRDSVTSVDALMRVQETESDVILRPSRGDQPWYENSLQPPNNPYTTNVTLWRPEVHCHKFARINGDAHSLCARSPCYDVSSGRNIGTVTSSGSVTYQASNLSSLYSGGVNYEAHELAARQQNQRDEQLFRGLLRGHPLSDEEAGVRHHVQLQQQQQQQQPLPRRNQLVGAPYIDTEVPFQTDVPVTSHFNSYSKSSVQLPTIDTIDFNVGHVCMTSSRSWTGLDVTNTDQAAVKSSGFQTSSSSIPRTEDADVSPTSTVDDMMHSSIRNADKSSKSGTTSRGADLWEVPVSVDHQFGLFDETFNFVDLA